MALLKKLNRTLGLTIVLITHEMDVVKELCNKVAVIHKGKIVESGSLQEIFATPQHDTTKEFLQHTTHEMPTKFEAKGALVKLSFKGKEAGQPIISQMIKRYDVDVNILYGWVESLQGVLIGNLILDIIGSEQATKASFDFLKEHHIHHEVL